MNFISIDPGKHIGIALWEDDICVKYYTIYEDDPNYTVEMLVECLLRWINTLDYIIVEAFKIVSFHGQNLEAIEQIGVIKHISSRHNVPCVLQQPSVRKPFESLTGPCRTPHERSAIAHGLYFLNKMKKEKWG